MVVEDGRLVSPEVVAAIWGGISGAVFGTVGSAGIVFLGRYLRRRGRLECVPERWRMAWLQYRGYGAHLPDDPLQGRVEETYYRRFSYDPAQEGTQEYVNFAEYALTVELINHADVEVVIRDLHTAFVKGGGVMFTHRPFDSDRTSDPSGVSDEDEKEIPQEDPSTPRVWFPDPTLEPVKTVSLPSRSPVRISLKGYLRTPDLYHVRGGYDEVRLRGTRWDGTLLDVLIPESGYAPA